MGPLNEDSYFLMHQSCLLSLLESASHWFKFRTGKIATTLLLKFTDLVEMEMALHQNVIQSDQSSSREATRALFRFMTSVIKGGPGHILLT